MQHWIRHIILLALITLGAASAHCEQPSQRPLVPPIRQTALQSGTRHNAEAVLTDAVSLARLAAPRSLRLLPTPGHLAKTLSLHRNGALRFSLPQIIFGNKHGIRFPAALPMPPSQYYVIALRHIIR